MAKILFTPPSDFDDSKKNESAKQENPVSEKTQQETDTRKETKTFNSDALKADLKKGIDATSKLTEEEYAMFPKWDVVPPDAVISLRTKKKII